MPASTGAPGTRIHLSLGEARSFAERHAPVGDPPVCYGCSPSGRMPHGGCPIYPLAMARRRELGDPTLHGGTTPGDDARG